MSDEKKVLTIQRSKWRRGGDYGGCLYQKCGPTQLLNEKGFMCCLGFDALARGISDASILGRTDPHQLTGEALPDGYSATHIEREGVNSVLVGAAIEANDTTILSDDERERRVKSALLNLGWDDVVFVD